MKRPKMRLRRLAIAVSACFASGVFALPSGPSVVSGSASVSQSGNVLNVTNSNGAILDWQKFGIAASETVRFLQPSASSSVLNRVVGADPSVIYGQLLSNGRVWLINPAGVMVGAGGRIDTAGFVASTLNVSNQDFLAGKLNFQVAGAAGTVMNQGEIVTPAGGTVYLIGTGVTNEGVIRTPQGEAILAAGQTVNLIDTATPGVKVEITGTAGAVTNLGEIAAAAGRIGMAAALVRNAGTLNASSVVSEGGRVFLRATKKIELAAGSRIEADGSIGGAIVAKTEDGGRVSGALVGRGTLSAQGDGSAGSGGFIETSAGTLDVDGLGIATRGGTWLIDPNDITISAGSDRDVTGNPNFVSTGDAAIITPATIEAASNAGTSVTIATASAAPNAEAGDITVSSPINAAVAGSGTTLTLSAARNIAVNQPIVSSGAALGLVLDHGAAGSATLAADLELAGGNLDVRSAGVPGSGTLNVTGGNSVLTGSLATTVLSVAGGTLALGTATATTLGTLNVSGGTLGSAGDLSVGTLNWTGGIIGGRGVLDVGTAINMASTNPSCYWCANTLYLDGKTLTNRGAAVLGSGAVGTGGIVNLNLRYGATLNNAAGATWSMNNGNVYDGGYAPLVGMSAFINAGALSTPAALGGGTIDVAFNNNGTVSLGGSGLTLSGGGTGSGTFDLAAGARLEFGGGTHTLTGATAITGAGEVVFGNAGGNGSTTIAGSVTANSLSMNGYWYNNATLDGALNVPTIAV
ncbi:MAG: filamentous hemagglutinin N-terminal domain-containing protein, partial [Rhodocyclales bacterium]|nr:filamentous hemagglutinin N-terminal domain-containing protein [Rhodocyclales bacterium]